MHFRMVSKPRGLQMEKERATKYCALFFLPFSSSFSLPSAKGNLLNTGKGASVKEWQQEWETKYVGFVRKCRKGVICLMEHDYTKEVSFTKCEVITKNV